MVITEMVKPVHLKSMGKSLVLAGSIQHCMHGIILCVHLRHVGWHSESCFDVAHAVPLNIEEEDACISRHYQADDVL